MRVIWTVESVLRSSRHLVLCVTNTSYCLIVALELLTMPRISLASCGAKACKASFLDPLSPRLMHIHSIGENLVWNDTRNSMCHMTGTSALDIEMQEL